MVHELVAAVWAARRRNGLELDVLLPEERIDTTVRAATPVWRGWLYTPAVTVWTFLAQCLSGDGSCNEAVAELIASRVARGDEPCSSDSSAYCTARDKLPEAACHELLRGTGRAVEDEAPGDWRWLGRNVRSVDGSTVLAADTPENQAAWPQQSTQAPGCGFPIVRIVVVFSLAVGTVLDMALAPCRGKGTGENSLLRTLLDRFEPGDVLLADRGFGSWCDVALFAERGLDAVVRQHASRETDFRRGRRLGRDDHVVTWSRPRRRPNGVDPETFARLPEEGLEMREVRVRVEVPGFRTKCLVVATTLLDAEAYPREAIADLYRRRWQAELDLRSIKSVLGMEHLRCKVPHRVRNEIRMHLTAYNLIRRVMAAAAIRSRTTPDRIGFKGTLQTLGRFLPRMATPHTSATAWLHALLDAIARHRVGHRPGRSEPRRVKRRPKTYKLLQKPRAQYTSTATRTR